MMLVDGMLLYHGSYAAVEEIDLEKCTTGKDFGRGFYLTSSRSQARDFISTSLRKAKQIGTAPINQVHGFVSCFRFHNIAGVNFYNFEEADNMWLWFIAMNRRKHLSSLLKDKVNPALFKSDIIIGKIADDYTNFVIAAYLNGAYGNIESEQSVQTAISLLMPDKLKDQYCFLTEKSIACLEFVEVKRYDR